MRGAESLTALFAGPTTVAVAPAIGVSTRVVMAPVASIQDAVNIAIAEIEATGLHVTAVAPLAGLVGLSGDVAVMITMQPVVAAYRRVVPADGHAYETWEDNARAGAAFLAYLVAGYLPKDEPVAPPDFDDPDEVDRLAGVRPLGGEEQGVAEVHTSHSAEEPPLPPGWTPPVDPQADNAIAGLAWAHHAVTTVAGPDVSGSSASPGKAVPSTS